MMGTFARMMTVIRWKDAYTHTMLIHAMTEMPVQMTIRVLLEIVRVCPFPVAVSPIPTVMTLICAQLTPALMVLAKMYR
jgi:hypothetical protein